MDNSAADRTAADPPAEEESGWTAYLEDFSCGGGSHVSSPSLVSDAAWNGTDCLVRRLDFKKLERRRNKWSYDDDLEDTASSPVNSPKVSSMRQMEVNYKRMDDVASNNFLEKQAVSNNFWKQGREERSGKNTVDSKNIDQYDELRKRGLCLVPMSTLMQYIG